MKKFVITLLIFSLPVLIVFSTIEIYLRTIQFPEKIKKQYLENHKNDISILAIGSSHYERGINPAFLKNETLNLGNSSQRIAEGFELLKGIYPEIPSLKLLIVEVSYDWLERDKTLTSPVVDRLNLLAYDINTYQRPLKPWDHLIFPVRPDYFSEVINASLNDEYALKYNRFGFDTTKYHGSYQAVGHQDSLILDKDIFVENAENQSELNKNSNILKKVISYCEERNVRVLIYNPPIHYRYKNLRKIEIVKRRDSILQSLMKSNPELKLLNLEETSDFEAINFYNGDHLNPKGAKKATKILNNFIEENYNF